MATKKVFFLESGPLVRCSCWQISLRTASLSEPSLLSFTSLQRLLPMSSSKSMKGYFLLCGHVFFLSYFLSINTPVTLRHCMTWEQTADLLCSPLLFRLNHGLFILFSGDLHLPCYLHSFQFLHPLQISSTRRSWRYQSSWWVMLLP